MMNAQRGLSLFGALVILVLAAVAGYFVYQGVMGEDATPSCSGTFSACIKTCRRTTSEAAAAQSCQQACQRDADECNRARR